MKTLNSIVDVAEFDELCNPDQRFWYLGSPYSAHPGGFEQAADEIGAVTAGMMRKGLIVFSPIVHCHPIAHKHSLPRDIIFWMQYDISMVRCAIGLLVAQLPGWDKSIGLTGETCAAMMAKRPIGFLTPKCMEEFANVAQ